MESTRTERRARRFGLACMAVTFLAAVVLAATGAGDAHAAGRPIRFMATFSAVKTIRWGEPRWSARADCWHRWWTEADGTQSEVYRSTKPVKALLLGNARSSGYIKWRTWDEHGDSATREMPGMGKLQRSASRTSDWEAGTCGVRGPIIDDEGHERPTPLPPPPDDCGSRQPAVYAVLGLDSRGAALSVRAAGVEQMALMSWRSCELQRPEEMQDAAWGDDVVTPIPWRRLLDPTVGVVELSGKKSYVGQRPAGGPDAWVISGGNVSWTVTLRRDTVQVIKGRKRR